VPGITKLRARQQKSIDTMRRRTFMQVLGPGFLVGAAVACEINKTRNDNVKTGSDAKTALDRHELEYLQQAIHLSELVFESCLWQQ
jgi:hypothetical protein